MGEERFILTEIDHSIGRIQLNRPEVLNALNLAMVDEIVAAMERMDTDPAVRVILLYGHEKAFAAGADIDEMADASAVEMVLRNQFIVWDRIASVAKPIVAAVSGFALGGGCELAMSCDLIVASETARFGQPEINLGVMPGAGGTQRLTKLIGRVKAMELLLTGESITSREALALGLVNRVVPRELYLEEAEKLAARIASQPPLAVRLIKGAVHRAVDGPLREGMLYERNGFYLTFASEDRAEGMAAFLAKRRPQFAGK